MDRSAISETGNTIDSAVWASKELKGVNEFNLENITVKTVIETSKRSLISPLEYIHIMDYYTAGMIVSYVYTYETPKHSSREIMPKIYTL